MSIGKLLIDDQPLQVLPSLAEAIGLNEALILQQIHWLLLRSKKEFKGKHWGFNTYEEWQEKHFRFFSVSTIRRTINHLEELNLLISSTEFNQMKVDKTKWYTINYEALDNLAIATAKNGSPSVQNEQSNCSNWADHSVQNEQTNNQENTQETPNNNPLPPKGESATPANGKINAENIPLPDYVDRETWIAYCRMRKAKRAEIKTEDTIKRCLGDLEKLCGGSPDLARAILDQSIANTYTGLFAPKSLPNRTVNSSASNDPFADNGTWGVGRKLNVDPSLIPEYLR